MFYCQYTGESTHPESVYLPLIALRVHTYWSAGNEKPIGKCPEIFGKTDTDRGIIYDLIQDDDVHPHKTTHSLHGSRTQTMTVVIWSSQ